MGNSPHELTVERTFERTFSVQRSTLSVHFSSARLSSRHHSTHPQVESWGSGTRAPIRLPVNKQSILYILTRNTRETHVQEVETAVQCVRFPSRALVTATLSLAALRFARGLGTSEERRCQSSFGACSQDDATLVENKRVPWIIRPRLLSLVPVSVMGRHGPAVALTFPVIPCLAITE